MTLRAGEMQTPNCSSGHRIPVKHRKQGRTKGNPSGSRYPRDQALGQPQPFSAGIRDYQQGLSVFYQENFVYYPSTQSWTFEHFVNHPPSQNLGLVVSLLRVFLQLLGWYAVFGGFWGLLSVGLGVF